MENPKRRALGAKVLNCGDKLLQLLALPFLRLKIAPNAISIAGALLVIVASILLFFGYRWSAVVISLLGSLLDNVDGRVARGNGQVSIWGAFLDSTLDRITETALAIGMVGYMHSQGVLSIPFVSWLVAAVGISQLVSYIRARIESLGGYGKVGLLQRQHRGILTFFGLVLGTQGVFWAIVIITLLSIVTAIQRMNSFHYEMTRKSNGA